MFLGGSVGAAVSTVLGGCAEKGQGSSRLQQAAVSYAPSTRAAARPSTRSPGDCRCSLRGRIQPFPSTTATKTEHMLEMLILLHTLQN